MNTNNSLSSNSISKKRERLEKGKRLNAHTYKKLFQIAGQKMKEVSQGDDHITTSDASKEVDEIIVMKSCSDPKQEKHSAELAEFQFKVTPKARDQDHVLPYVNKLRDFWHRGHNSVFFDGQDRIIKVVFFVLSILDKVKQPFLILTSSSALSLWESEFSKWMNSTNFVTYKENKDLRESVTSSEFYNENGSIKFQVILSSPDVIIEGFEKIGHIKWELIVIDECQRNIISKHFMEIKTLATDMKLVTVTSETVNYQNILSILDSKYEDMHMDMDADVDTNALKEKLSPFVAFECKFNASEIEEYWVPVHLSNIQIEQYCSLLNSNFEVLTSSVRNSSSLNDILTQTQKCCDHPYLVDPDLRKSLKTNAPIDRLDAEIEASGKLQLLDKLLLEIKRRRLRVLVLFQSVVSSEKITIGDILEDLVDRRFGQDSYVRIQPKILSASKRKEAVNMFNNINSETFVCLLDYHDCQPTIRLSSVDLVILFNSDWNPSNDLKDLHKLTLEIDPHSNPLRIFRLYSSFTIEEKSLILSKQGTITYRVNYNTCHRLLAWGASYLFNNKDPESKSKSKSKSDTCVDDLVHELLNKTGNINRLKSLFISKAPIHEGVYSKNILLIGETEPHTKESCSNLSENEPNVFWSNLFKESQHINPQGKSSSRFSRRVKKSFRHPWYWFGDFETESESDIENIEKKTIKSHFVKKKLRSKRKSRGVSKRAGKLPTVTSTCISDPIPSISSTNNVAQCTNNQPPLPPVSDKSSITTPLETELENIKKEREEVTKLHQEKKSKLVSDCEKEMLEIRKKYDALIDESEMCLTKKMKVLEDYYDLVYANKVLAETVEKTCDDHYNEEKTEKVRIVEIPASTLIQSDTDV
ncbi:hypothetical protein L2E82_28336 [Cichorium intybus]|uniref:Uncharacterized protein n=1 Tax=Cichorium intybus TaxID=13427 RepID=A0ACB9CVN2_CICIN|nr:hypothetical protein L2E82_28336 [Cichorium intybus]